MDGVYWDRTARQMGREGFPSPVRARVGEVKRRAYLGLLKRWPVGPGGGWVLKTDLFDEAFDHGPFLRNLADGALCAVGMDISFAVTARARERSRSAGAAFVVADTRRLPFRSGAFNRVVSPSTLDHFPDSKDLARSLAEIARILQPGGDLIVTLDNRQNVTDFLLRLARNLRWIPFYLGRSSTVRELERAVRGAGLRPEDRTAIVHHPRLAAILAIEVLDRVKHPGLTRLFTRLLNQMQKLEQTPWRYWTGCFVAVRAYRPPGT